MGISNNSKELNVKKEQEILSTKVMNNVENHFSQSFKRVINLLNKGLTFSNPDFRKVFEDVIAHVETAAQYLHNSSKVLFREKSHYFRSGNH